MRGLSPVLATWIVSRFNGFLAPGVSPLGEYVACNARRGVGTAKIPGVGAADCNADCITGVCIADCIADCIAEATIAERRGDDPKKLGSVPHTFPSEDRTNAPLPFNDGSCSGSFCCFRIP